jgi:hypothetical protein
VDAVRAGVEVDPAVVGGVRVDGGEEEVLVHRARVEALGVGVQVVGWGAIELRPNDHLRLREATKRVRLAAADRPAAVQPVHAGEEDVLLEQRVVVHRVGVVGHVHDERLFDERPL